MKNTNACRFPLVSVSNRFRWFSLILSILLTHVAIADWMYLGPDPGPIDEIECSDHSSTVVAKKEDILFVSKDNGETWNRLFPDSSFTSFSISPWDDNSAWLTNGYDVTEVDLGAGSFFDVVSMASLKYFSLTLDPHRFGHMIRTQMYPNRNGQILESTDSGRTWEPRTLDLPMPVSSIVFSPVDPNLSAVLSNHGICISKDSLTTWRELPGLPQIPWHLQFSSEGDLIGIYQTDQLAILRYDENGWIMRSAPAGLIRFILWRNSLDVIVALTRSGVFRSIDEGLSWHPIEIAPETVDLAGNLNAIFLATAEGVWVSEDAGASFHPRNTGLHASPAGQFTFDPMDPSIWYFVMEPGIFRSIDEGATWEEIDIVPEGGAAQGLCFDPIDPEQAYLSIHFVEGHRIYSSRDRLLSLELFWVSDGYADRGSSGSLCFFPDSRDGMLLLDNSAYHYHAAVGTGYESILWRFDAPTHEWTQLKRNSILMGPVSISRINPDFIIIKNGTELCCSRDGGTIWECNDDLPLMFWEQLPENSELYLASEYLDGEARIALVDMNTHQSSLRETEGAGDFIFLDDHAREYLMATSSVLRSDAGHLRGIPIGDFPHPASRIVCHPEDPTRLFAVWRYAGLSEIRFDPDSIPPAEPELISVESDEERMVLAWRLSPEATGTRIFLGESPGVPSQVLIVPYHQEAIEITWQSVRSDADFGYVSLSAYDSNGRESSRTDEVVAPIGRHLPVIEMFGGRTESMGTNRIVIVSALVRDPQGAETIRSLNLLIDHRPTGIELIPTGQASADRGIFQTVIPIPASVSSDRLAFQLEVTDEDGNLTRSDAPVTVRKGAAWGLYKKPVNVYY